MRALFLATLILFPLMTGCASGGSNDEWTDDEGGTTCCKTCGSNSQACGDSCIGLDDECHTSGGCACEG